MHEFDLVIAYRIYPGISKQPAYYSDDKFKLSTLCLHSLIESLGDLKVKIYAILDNCPDEYSRLFRHYFDSSALEIINVPPSGNAKTFKKQIDILLNQDYSEYIYFAEDDYFYLPDKFHLLLDFLKNNDVDFVSAYDHLDYYNHPIHSYKMEYINSGSQRWKKVNSTCLTFLTTKTVLRKTQKIFETYLKNNYDNTIWMSLTKINIYNPRLYFLEIFKHHYIKNMLVKLWFYSGKQILFGDIYKLYVPEPTFAAHMEKECLPPGFDWINLFEETNKKLIFDF